LLGGGVVLVGDGAVGDAGVDEGRPHRVVAEEGGDRFEAHASVDRLGRQRVAQGVRVDVTNAGDAGTAGDDPGDGKRSARAL
jgi:hypothetical protein